MNTALKHRVSALNSLGLLLMREELIGLDTTQQDAVFATVLLLVFHDVSKTGPEITFQASKYNRMCRSASQACRPMVPISMGLPSSAREWHLPLIWLMSQNLACFSWRL